MIIFHLGNPRLNLAKNCKILFKSDTTRLYDLRLSRDSKFLLNPNGTICIDTPLTQDSKDIHYFTHSVNSTNMIKPTLIPENFTSTSGEYEDEM